MKTVPNFDWIGEENAFAVLARATALAAQGRDIINLGIGQPDFRTPDHIVEAAIKAMRDGHHGYTPATGIKPLREAVAADLHKRFKVEVSPDEVMIMPGGKPTMYMSILMFGAPGVEILYPDPGFPIYRSMIEYTGATPVPVPIREENSFAFSAAETLKLITPRTRLLILNSPANPTGGMIPREDLAQIAAMLRDRDVLVLSDEIYSRICYGVEPASITQFDGMLDKTIILDGFSKTYSMTGWRLGYGVMPLWVADAVDKLMVNSNSCTASFTQRAGLAALQGPQDDVDKMVAEFRRRRDAIVKGLNDIPGFRCSIPAGAFYVFPNVTGTGLSSRELADMLLNDAGVACLSGTAFGKYGDGYLRFSYANSLENIQEALARIRKLSERWATAGVR